jgi:hypothetical protein
VKLKAIKQLVEADALKMEIIPNPKVGALSFHYLLESKVVMDSLVLCDVSA